MWIPSVIPRALAAIGLGPLVGLVGCGSRCEQDVAREGDCGIEYAEDDLCEDPEFACQLRCYAAVGCSELRAHYFSGGSVSLSVSYCLQGCREGVRCDGEPPRTDVLLCDGFVECRDGTDEEDCSYHLCEDGQQVVEWAECNGYPECEDESDEDGC